MAGLPKKYAKMGFKKGWAAYKRTKRTKRSSARKPKTKTRRVKSMAKRKYYKKAKRYARRGFNWANQFKGAGLVVAYESLIEPMVPVSGVAKNALALGAGAYMAKKKGAVGQAGKTLIAINAVQLMRQFAAPVMQNLVGSLGGMLGGSNGGSIWGN